MKQWRPERPATYAARTHASPYWPIRYAHQRRFQVAGQLVGAAEPALLLDYGSGDGHFLIELLQADILTPETQLFAFEPVPQMTDILRANLEAHHCDHRVVVITDIDELSDLHFDYVTCLEVLEHLPLSTRFVFYDFLKGALITNGLALIGVPVEIGPSLLIKEFGRRVLKRDPPDYGLRELLRIATGGAVFDPVRFDPNELNVIARHRGFDHRLLCQEVEQNFAIAHRTPTPLPYLPAWLGNQELLLTIRRSP